MHSELIFLIDIELINFALFQSLRNLYKMIEEADNRKYNSKRGWKHRPSNRSRSRDRSSDRSSRSNSNFMKPSDEDKIEEYVSRKESSSQSREVIVQ